MRSNLPRPRMSRTTRPDLSVIIVNRNTRELLAACLRSIAELPDRVVCEIIVVDNGSSDGSPEMVIERFPSVHLIRNQTNTGFAYPNNQGLAVSRGRHVMLLNSDTEVQPGTRSSVWSSSWTPTAMWAPADPSSSTPMGARSLPAAAFRPCGANSVTPSFWIDFSGAAVGLGISSHISITCTPRRWTSRPARRWWCAGRVLETVGPLDERFKIYYNDVDWCYRIHLAGWKIYFVHDAVVIHHWGATTRSENRRMQLGAEMTRNRFDYYAKHFGARGLRWFRFWTVIGYSVRRVAFGLLSVFSSADAVRWRARYYAGTLRAALTGDPDRFGRDRGVSSTNGGSHLPLPGRAAPRQNAKESLWFC